MKQAVEIVISADIPDDDAEIGHTAVHETRDAAHAIVEALHKLGLTNARQVRKIVRRKVPAVAAVAAAVEG